MEKILAQKKSSLLSERIKLRNNKELLMKEKNAAPKKKVRKQKPFSHMRAAYVLVLFLFLGVFIVANSISAPQDHSAVLAATTSRQSSGFSFSDFFNSFFSRFSFVKHPAGNTTQSVSPTMAASTTHTDTIDVHAIPLGDGKISTEPKMGYVYSCDTNLTGGGAEHAGDWIQGNTWDLTKKIYVEGSVAWPTAKFVTSIVGAYLTLTGNGLPVNAITGIFPIQRSDPAYQYDRNPNSIKEQTVSYQLSANPTFAATSSCVPMGAVGYALNGVAIYNALDAAGRDAVAHEVQDSCSGHPQQAGEYHYHGPSSCMPHSDENNALVGYALDGFGIYSMYDASGKVYTDADLDECHGITSEIALHGKTVNMYHYVLTHEYPYTIGCFRGTPVRIQHTGGNRSESGIQNGGQIGGAQGQSTTAGQGMQQGTHTPPQAAITVCSGKSSGTSCSFSGQNGTITGMCQTPPGQTSAACIPTR
jgi:YHYH protein